MSALINLTLVVCVVVMVLLTFRDFMGGRQRRGLLLLCFLVGVVVALNLTIGFPIPNTERTAFGGTFPTLLAIGLMFAGVMLGMLANYIWQKPERFLLVELIRPLVASPLILLPLIGSLEGSALQPVQLISLTLLAFQNGFFWPRVLRDAQPTTT